ncbi:MAG: sigma-54-dependent Fis family transcriptional regulator [Candidatus Hydrogenedentota bacterium]|nr:MAG: sigma-54-dependent Fis family transcriptional regulator [Candidatus Hydrogenedentota bacterium]
MIGKVIIIDDEPDILSSLSAILADEGYSVETSTSFTDKIDLANADLLLLDIWLINQNGVEILEAVKKDFPDVPVVMISGHGNIRLAVDCIKKGAYDFIEKPFDLERVLTTVRNAVEISHLKKTLQKERETRLQKIRFVTENKDLIASMEQLKKVYGEARVFWLSGEAGVGKKRLATYIELTQNPATKIEKVSFSDFLEVKEKNQTFPIAYFMDMENVSESALETLPTFLDSLSREETVWFLSRSVPPANTIQWIPIHYRIPKLFARKEDVPVLIRYYVEEFSQSLQKPSLKVSKEAMLYLQAYHWPGNVRELKNFVERACLFTQEETIRVETAQNLLEGGTWLQEEKPIRLKEAVQSFERNYILYMIRKNAGNISKTAEDLGVERTHLYRKLKGLGIENPRQEALEL